MVDLTAYQAFLDSAPDAMLVVGTNGTIRMANAQVEQLFGHLPAELLGQPVEALLPERLRDYHVAHRRAFVADPRPRPMGTGMELWALNRDGREFPVEISLSPLVTAGERLVVAAVRDITARREVEQALREAKETAESATSTKSRFLAAAGHDMRQPLQTMKMYLGALARQPLPTDQANLVGKMDASLRGLAEILDSLLDIARLDTGKVDPVLTEFSIADLLQQLVDDIRPIADAKRLQLRCRPSGYLVCSDAGLLSSVVGNLLANAVRHTEHGAVLIGCRYRGDAVSIEIRDSGPGIPTTAHDRIFDEYVQLGNPARLRSQGLGLGLSMVRRLAELLGHPFGLRSAVGRGSTFWVEVPRLGGSNRAATAVRQPERTYAERGRRVLFIEDDPDVSEATGLILELKGCEVLRAASGEEAYRALADRDFMPDIILSDFRLPGRENGAQVVQRVRTLLDREVPTLFMTGDTSEARIRETRLPHCEVLHKPVDADKLSRAIESVIAAAGVDSDPPVGRH